MIRANNKFLLGGIGFALLLPMFYQLSGGIYNTFIFESGGILSTLPIPISVPICTLGIVLLLAHYQRAKIAGMFIAALLAAMLLSVVFSGADVYFEPRKLILLAQFILPTLGLAVGQLVNDEKKVIANAFLAVLILIVPLQLAATWSEGSIMLTHNLRVFSVYQHLQFVPIVFVCAFVYTMAALWDTHRILVLILAPRIFIYALASGSFLAVGGFALSMLAFGYQMLRRHTTIHYSLILSSIGGSIVIAIIGAGAFYGIASKLPSHYGDNGVYVGKFFDLSKGKLPKNVSERLADWKMFGEGILESPRTIVLGHAAPLARTVRTSAHNWYIDIAYSFGVISLLPMAALIGYTAYLYRNRKDDLPLETQWLLFIVFFLVLIDNNFKVTLRQPYSGIFVYFMWGLLLTQLRAPHPSVQPS